ncbi:PTS sugar transporter subunit IIA [Cardiobacteriaceae bacterium TAE3-ERU3]|nr:PTS sugar transporter subunit IIA [Cardiobacteriaceae bacterium TAE3-ERU3]
MSDVKSLVELLAPEQVKAKQDAADWREAVAIAGQLLVDAGCCTGDYVRAMQEGVIEFGPYIVIAPGVAMPHARPEAGVLKPGVSIITLAEPREFGNEANDPVDFVIAFSAVDKNAHIQTLQQIVGLLESEDTMAAVRAAASDDELWAALEQHHAN